LADGLDEQGQNLSMQTILKLLDYIIFALPTQFSEEPAI
jgi:hypothetical protein